MLFLMEMFRSWGFSGDVTSQLWLSFLRNTSEKRIMVPLRAKERFHSVKYEFVASKNFHCGILYQIAITGASEKWKYKSFFQRDISEL